MTLAAAVLDDVYSHVFAGYTVSSVIVGDWRRLYVAGAPRFKHKGKVILFDLSDEGDVNIVQALNGEQVKLCSVSPLPLLHFICWSREEKRRSLISVEARTPPTGSNLKEHVSVCRLGLTTAVRCAGWILTKMASLMSSWSQLQCILAQETRKPAESTSTLLVG